MDSGETGVIQLFEGDVETLDRIVHRGHICTAWCGFGGAQAAVCKCGGVFPFIPRPGVTFETVSQAHRAEHVMGLCASLGWEIPGTFIRSRPTLEELHRRNPMPIAWPNGCDTTVPKALRYLADHDRPQGGEQWPNAECLLQMAGEIEAAVKASRNAKGES